jgi:hypothetical protein
MHHDIIDRGVVFEVSESPDGADEFCPIPGREGEKIRRAFEKSDVVCFALRPGDPAVSRFRVTVAP